MTNIRSFSVIKQSCEPVTAEEGLRMIKTFESIARKSDRDAVIAFAERLARLGNEPVIR
ncbi:hypothetical protein [Afipia massiliensis]|uniref:hypothetical protein n=1 Tax=Afipia massiliensis TaxID=211460 RepID=UPI000AB4ED69|nr:hypothetical protein [Afipia massiliensis]